jgi:hypothetical protein
VSRIAAASHVHLVEGIAPGIGFPGAGAILKLAAEKDIVSRFLADVQ